MYFEIYEEKTGGTVGPPRKTGKWRWRARAQNGNILADSGQGYKGGRSAVMKRINKFLDQIRTMDSIKIKDLSCRKEWSYVDGYLYKEG